MLQVTKNQTGQGSLSLTGVFVGIEFSFEFFAVLQSQQFSFEIFADSPSRIFHL